MFLLCRLLLLLFLFIWFVHDDVCSDIIYIERSISTLLRGWCSLLLIVKRISRYQNTFNLLSFSCPLGIKSLDYSTFLGSLELAMHVILNLLGVLSFTLLNLQPSLVFNIFSSWRDHLLHKDLVVNLHLIDIEIGVVVLFVIDRAFRFENFIWWLYVLINYVILIGILKALFDFMTYLGLDVSSLLYQLVFDSLRSGCVLLDLAMNFEWI